jgi:hypothetical protein
LFSLLLITPRDGFGARCAGIGATELEAAEGSAAEGLGAAIVTGYVDAVVGSLLERPFVVLSIERVCIEKQRCRGGCEALKKAGSVR